MGGAFFVICLLSQAGVPTWDTEVLRGMQKEKKKFVSNYRGGTSKERTNACRARVELRTGIISPADLIKRAARILSNH